MLLSILFNGTSVKTQISPELQFLLIYPRTTFTNYFWLFEVVWFCCLVERHDLLKSMTVYLIILYARIQRGLGKGNEGKDSNSESQDKLKFTKIVQLDNLKQKRLVRFVINPPHFLLLHKIIKFRLWRKAYYSYISFFFTDVVQSTLLYKFFLLMWYNPR